MVAVSLKKKRVPQSAFFNPPTAIASHVAHSTPFTAAYNTVPSPPPAALHPHGVPPPASVTQPLLPDPPTPLSIVITKALSTWSFPPLVRYLSARRLDEIKLSNRMLMTPESRETNRAILGALPGYCFPERDTSWMEAVASVLS